MEMSMSGVASKAQAPQAPAVWDAKAEAAAADAPAEAPGDPIPAADAAEKPMEQDTVSGRIKVKLTRGQMEELLSGYTGTEHDGGVAYALTAAEMDAVLAKIPAGNVIPGGDMTAGQGSCLLVVYLTE